MKKLFDILEYVNLKEKYSRMINRRTFRVVVTKQLVIIQNEKKVQTSDKN